MDNCLIFIYNQLKLQTTYTLYCTLRLSFTTEISIAWFDIVLTSRERMVNDNTTIVKYKLSVHTNRVFPNNTYVAQASCKPTLTLSRPMCLLRKMVLSKNLRIFSGRRCTKCKTRFPIRYHRTSGRITGSDNLFRC